MVKKEVAPRQKTNTNEERGEKKIKRGLKNCIKNPVEISSNLFLTGCSIYKTKGFDTLKAFADITFNNCLAVKGLKILARKADGALYIAMPSKEVDGDYFDVVFPTTKDCRDALNEALTSVYQTEED